MRRYRDVGYDSARWDGFLFRDDDVVISAPAKCGTTWAQMLVALLVFGTTSLPDSLSRLSPWLDMQTRSLDEVRATLDAQRHRRFIKTHTPLDGIPFDARVTYVTIGRDPRDVGISFLSQSMNVNQEAFLAQRAAAVGNDDLAELARAPFPPPTSLQEVFRRWIDFEPDGTTWGLAGTVHHLSTFWERRAEPNVVMLHYADLHADLLGNITALAQRIGIDRTPESLRELAAAASFAEMKRAADVLAPNADQNLWRNNADFFRSGQHGQWMDTWDADTVAAYETRVAALADTDQVRWMQSGAKLRL